MMNNNDDDNAPYSDRPYSDTVVESFDDETDSFDDVVHDEINQDKDKPMRYFDIDVEEKEVVHDALPLNTKALSKNRQQRKTKLCRILLGLAIFGILVTAIHKRRREEKFRAAMVSLMAIGTLPGAFMEKNSPQKSALRWMIEQDPLRLPLPSTTNDPFVQRYAIAVMTFALMTPNQHQVFHLLSGVHECEWNSEWESIGDEQEFMKMGILCDDDQSVTDILLPHANLHGELPFELELLSHLQRLDLGDGLIEGTIPPMPPYLRDLNLANNQITGILQGYVSDLTHLTSLNLSGNSIRGTLPGKFGALTNLQVLNLERNSLTGGLEEIDALTNLEELYLAENSFDHQLLPDSFKELSDLRVIDVRNNRLSGPYLPDNLSRFPHLEVMDLSNNSMDGHINHVIPETHPLKYLDISHNLLGGGLPTSISNLASLTHLDISYNRFNSRIPRDSLGALTNLKTLLLTEDDDMGVGPLPEWLREMTDLTYLSFRLATRTGTIPTWFGELTNLELLDLDWNHISGTIPTELGLLTNLQYLMLNRNLLTGTVPTEVLGLPKLKLLMLDTNDLQGSVLDVCESTRIEQLVADCSKVECPCCTSCCDDGAERCNMKDWILQIDSIPRYEKDLDPMFVPVV